MAQAAPVSIASIPSPLRWLGVPQEWELDAQNNLTITAPPLTDWFIDPGGAVDVRNAPALLFPVQQPCQLRARVTAAAAAKYDAGVLVAYHGDRAWAKLCLELSPQGQLTIVSVVTKGVSDDCNSVPVNGDAVYLRLSRLERAYAFHYSYDATVWSLVRYFSLDESTEAEIGFIAQSPAGQGCRAGFSEIAYLPEKLDDIRSGE